MHISFPINQEFKISIAQRRKRRKNFESRTKTVYKSPRGSKAIPTHVHAQEFQELYLCSTVQFFLEL